MTITYWRFLNMLKIAPYIALSLICTLVQPSSLLASDPLGAVDDLLGDVGASDFEILFGKDEMIPSAQSSASHGAQPTPSAQQQPGLVQDALNLGKEAGQALSNTSTNVQAALTTPNAQTIGTAITGGVHDAVNVGKHALPVVKQGVETGVGLAKKGLELGKSLLGHLPGKTSATPGTPQSSAPLAGAHTGAAPHHTAAAPIATHQGSSDLNIDALLQ
jgi:hypothetical protein